MQKPANRNSLHVYRTQKGTILPLIDLRGKPYMLVAHRLVALNELDGGFTVKTEFPVLTETETVCHARITIFSTDGKILKEANGIKRECKKDFNDHTEKAETGAIGRALAAIGIGTQFAEQDFELEFDRGQPTGRLADSPVKPIAKPKEKTALTAVTDTGRAAQAALLNDKNRLIENEAKKKAEAEKALAEKAQAEAFAILDEITESALERMVKTDLEKNMEPIPLVDQLKMITEARKVPLHEVAKIITRTVGVSKKAKDLSEAELIKVIHSVSNYIPESKS